MQTQQDSQGETLTIVIPALDEEAAIGDTVRRCLEARGALERAGIAAEVIVVSDGSSDRTEAIACSFEEATVLVFATNRGYGAAIKCGFEHGRGELVGFLDADGTCAPEFFVDLCRALREHRADVAIGSRMGPGSRMPWVRAIGNRLFAWMLGLLSKRLVLDTASGMRVIRRDRLGDLYPLPDGLHFTPAMSARVLLEDRLKLVEVPMAYAERLGRSKLSVLRDGVRFLRVIAQAAMCYRPARPLMLVALLLALAGLAIGIGPALFFLKTRTLEEWMIYRVLLASFLATATAMVLCAAAVADRIAALTHRRQRFAGWSGLLGRGFELRLDRIGIGVLLAAAVVLVWPGIEQYVTTGLVEMHWSRAVLASLLLVLAVVIALTSFLLAMLELIRAARTAPVASLPPDRVRPGR